MMVVKKYKISQLLVVLFVQSCSFIVAEDAAVNSRVRRVITPLECGVNILDIKHNKYSSLAPTLQGPAKLNEAPWLVRVIEVTPLGRQWICNGVIVGAKTILSTASCFDDYHHKQYEVVAGDHSPAVVEFTETTLQITKVVIHLHFRRSTKIFDFALLFTSSWGNGDFNPDVQRKNTLVASPANCFRASTMAACFGTTTSDVCNADLGSPLEDVRAGKFFLSGIANTVDPVCISNSNRVLYGLITPQIVVWIMAQSRANEAGAVPVTRPPTMPITTSTKLPPISIRNEDIGSCGKTAYTLEDDDTSAGTNKAKMRVIGGTAAKVNEVPWQVRIANATNGRTICGGVIIHERGILTAAHCVFNQPLSQLKLLIGDHSLLRKDDCEQAVTVAKAIVHEGFNIERPDPPNDFALLITEETMSFDTWAIQPICLPAKSALNESYTNRKAMVSGWGRISNSFMNLADTLQVATVTVYSNVACSEAADKFYEEFKEDDFPQVTITNQMVCAVGVGKDTCNGDSGGPLATFENGRHTLIGITSFGIDEKCASNYTPGVYARVTSALDWLEKQMKTHNLRLS